MAPEVILRKGYSFQADVWSLGIILFEMIAGECPFGEKLEDPYQIYQEIISSNFQLPDFILNKPKFANIN